MLTILRNQEVNGGLRLGFLGRYNDEPNSLLFDQIAADFDCRKIFIPQRQ
jgi:hypothetical protein